MYKRRFNIFRYALSLAITLFSISKIDAQTIDCAFKEPTIKIDFGNASNSKAINLSILKAYRKSNSSCPDDGEYSFVSATANCFGSKWHNLSEDHTVNDVGGNFMLVNASERPSTFFMNNIIGLAAGKTYELSFWVVNICKYADGCSPTPPNLKITLLNGNSEITNFQTKAIAQTAQPFWKKFYGEFAIPQNASMITIKMEDLTIGGCGNDFAIDDIMFKECKIKDVEVKVRIPSTDVQITKPKQEEKTKPIQEVKVKPQQQTPPVVTTQKIEQPKVIIKTLEPSAIKTTVKQMPVIVPKLIATRENTLIRKIETEESEIQIELYDNGEIDGDTVTIFHNNKLVVNHAGLSAKPITVKIKVDKNNPHHELIMVADNLGSIPPNTSLMIITANKKRYEVYISSSEQKNAKVVIDLK
jgi:hypothetical protein